MPDAKTRYPHLSGTLVPMASFRIGEKRISLYSLKGHNPNGYMSMYWDDDTAPIQHRMDWGEVVKLLEHVLEAASA